MRLRIKAPKAAQLIKEIEKHLPLPVYLTPEAAHSLRAKGKSFSTDTELQVSSVLDSGDMGGILCTIAEPDAKEVVMISLTHLRIRPDHPLRVRVEAYQRERVRQLSKQR